jgi:hypothetical protein
MVKSKFNLDFWFVSYNIFSFVYLVGAATIEYRVNTVLL